MSSSTTFYWPLSTNASLLGYMGLTVSTRESWVSILGKGLAEECNIHTTCFNSIHISFLIHASSPTFIQGRNVFKWSHLHTQQWKGFSTESFIGVCTNITLDCLLLSALGWDQDDINHTHGGLRNKRKKDYGNPTTMKIPYLCQTPHLWASC